MEYRELKFEEIDQIWSIDRTKYVHSVYRRIGNGLKEKIIETMIEGWPSREAEINDPILKDCFRRGGFLFGAFDKETLKAVVVIDPKWRGKDMKTLELRFLYVDKNYRREGVGKFLFNKAVEKARALGAYRLYISSSESKNTVEFYRSLGCELVSEVDWELFALEPKDIHMELDLDRLVENG